MPTHFINAAHAEWTSLASQQPGVAAALVEVVATRQPPEVVTLCKVRQANSTSGPRLFKQLRCESHKFECRDLVSSRSLHFSLLALHMGSWWKEQPEAKECDESTDHRLQDHEDCDPVDARAIRAAASIHHPNNAKDKPTIREERDVLACPPCWRCCERRHASLNAPIFQLGASNPRKQHEAHRNLKQLQHCVYEQPPPQRAIAPCTV
mmetsp:Transcript_45295/g.84977  ORF Transcript_45295/g.84977 Transcript_45295/m.84977 type:complete len:208 (+) Transcript_45295:94-717(+)